MDGQLHPASRNPNAPLYSEKGLKKNQKTLLLHHRISKKHASSVIGIHGTNDILVFEARDHALIHRNPTYYSGHV